MVTKEKNPNILKWTLIRFAISVAGAVIAVGIFVAATREEVHESKEAAQAALVTNQQLLHAIVRNCEDNGNPLREVLQNILTREKEQIKKEPLFEQLFPQTNPAELRKLISEQVHTAIKELRIIAPVNCKNQYHPEEGHK